MHWRDYNRQHDYEKKTGQLALSQEFKEEISTLIKDSDHKLRLTKVLAALPVCERAWYRKQGERKRPGPKASSGINLDPNLIIAVCVIAQVNPWYGYKRIAVILRREGWEASNRQVYKGMKKHNLLKKNKPNKAEMYQAKKLYELLPQRPNQLWQADVTYVHVPGHGWWYAVTVIDYFSRYLLACHFTPSYRAADCCEALQVAKAEAERLCGKLNAPVFLVTDNGSSFLARRFAEYLKDDNFTHVRIQYRTPQQLGLLERFHQTLKKEEVYWNIYNSPASARESLEKFRQRYNTYRPHWALIPEQGGDPMTPHDVYVLGKQTKIPKWQAWARQAKKKIDAEITATELANTGS